MFFLFELIKLLFSCLKTLVLGPRRFGEILNLISQMGVGSLPIILISTSFAGLVVTDEIAHHMDVALHTLAMMPGFSAQFIFREIGIAIPSLLFVSKVGASTTAEVASMTITEQIDALKLLHINPTQYIVYPRFIASIITVACLTMIAIFITLLCSTSVAVYGYGFSYLEYINTMKHFIKPIDLICALSKSLSFGAIIPLISCYYGFRCTGGAQGVGTSTTNAVVASTISIIIIDFLLTFAFSFIL